MDDLGRLEIDAAATFVLDAEDRIVRENDPAASPGPRLYFSGCQSGNIVRVHQNLPTEIAREIASRVRGEPSWSKPNQPPNCLPAIVKILSRETPAEVAPIALIYELPQNSVFVTDARMVSSDTGEGDRLLSRLAHDGIPDHLAEAGFRSTDDFWSPWCVALESRQIAAMAFAARLGREGAECGVYTFPAFRGRGLAAAATAAWSAMTALSTRSLFYSTHVGNASSLAVAGRLGLRRVGISVRVN